MATNPVTSLFFGMMSGDDASQHPSPAPSLPGANRFVPHPLEKISEFGRALGCYRKAAHKLNPRFFPPLWKKTLDNNNLWQTIGPPDVSREKELRRGGVLWDAMAQTPPDSPQSLAITHHSGISSGEAKRGKKP